MVFIVRRRDGQEIAVAADRLCVEAADEGLYRFHGPDGAFLTLPANEVEHVRIDDKLTFPHGQPRARRPVMRSG